MGNDGPGPDAIEVELCWVGVSTGCLEGVDRPHSKIAHQEEGNLKQSIAR